MTMREGRRRGRRGLWCLDGWDDGWNGMGMDVGPLILYLYVRRMQTVHGMAWHGFGRSSARGRQQKHHQTERDGEKMEEVEVEMEREPHDFYLSDDHPTTDDGTAFALCT